VHAYSLAPTDVPVCKWHTVAAKPRVRCTDATSDVDHPALQPPAKKGVRRLSSRNFIVKTSDHEDLDVSDLRLDL
jgi:hypothetical protein